MTVTKDRNGKTVDVTPNDVWSPEYFTTIRDSVGDKSLLTPISDIRSVECPVSLLSRGNGPAIRQQALSVLDAQMVHQTTGLYPGGSDPLKWSARWYDLVMMGQNEVLRVKAAREELVDNVTRMR